MAEKDDKGLIGFDPLAWMDGEGEETEIIQKQKAVDTPVIEAEKVTDTVNDDNKASIEQLVEPIIENETSLGEDNILILDGTLNIQNVNHLYEQLLLLLENHSKIELDASAVVSVDTASLQLLIVLKQTVIKQGKELIFDFPTDKFIEAAELLGIAEMLDIDQAAAGFF